LTRFDMGKAFVGAVKSRARKGVVRPSMEDMSCAGGARVLRPAKHETRWSCRWAKGNGLSEIAVGYRGSGEEQQ
jgi:hypothetical protein